MSLAKNQANYFNLGNIGWKYYNSIKKKAVEQEFSWSGLLISLSIAFFIVAVSALFLNFVFTSIEAGKRQGLVGESANYLERTNQVDLSAVKYINITNRG